MMYHTPRLRKSLTSLDRAFALCRNKRSPIDSRPLRVLQRALGNGSFGVLQAKLAVGAPNDRYEREADRVADEVLRTPAPAKGGAAVISNAEPGPDLIRRMCAECEREDEERQQPAFQAKAMSSGACDSAPESDKEEPDQMIQRKEDTGGFHVNQRFLTQLRQSAAGGQKLPTAIRLEMEARFGHSFGQVHIHTDRRAVEMTRQLNAEAFATGDHIYLNAGRYNPTTFSGKRLLAHELTHVLQQRSSPEKTVGSMPISNVGRETLQSYRLRGFPAPEEAKMHSAIATAISKVSSCDHLTWLGKLLIKNALRRLWYDYVPDLGYCGWTFPSSWYVEIGKTAFDTSECCDLASTLAHEASHTRLYTEGRARKMECECFGCSC